MFNEPILFNLIKKYCDIALIIFVTLIYITMCAEADMYVPAFPQMIEYFGVAENQIQLILSVNFIGSCFAGLIAGPLSDAYGRRTTLLIGLFLFVVSSAGCVFTDNFKMMLFYRLLQGVAASVPMVVAGALFFDKYSSEKAGRIIGFANSFISASMAGAPIIGAWISEVYNWRANFIFILALALISFLAMLLFIEETLPQKKRNIFKISVIIKNYLRLVGSFNFLTYCVMASFSFTAIVLYISNLSVILINHIGLSLEVFGYYQATTMGTFIIFSLMSSRLIIKLGLDYTKNLGTILCLIGASILLLVGLLDVENVNAICLAMAILAAGSAMMTGTFGSKAMAIFPDINGTALAMMAAIRQLLAFGLIILSEIFFTGTILPVAVLIFSTTLLAVIAYLVACFKQ